MIVKGGAAIEQLGQARTVILDKTGTLTLGTPEIERLVPLGGSDGTEMLRLAASVDQLSAHSLAEALVLGARQRGIDLSFPEKVDEGAGQGAEGLVEGRRVAVGSESWLAGRGYPVPPQAMLGLDGANGAGRPRSWSASRVTSQVRSSWPTTFARMRGGSWKT